DTDFVGTDEFEYTVCDKNGNCDTATVTVDCGLPEPDAVDDYVSTPKDTPVDIDILDNDSNIPSDGTLTVTQPDNGTVTVNDNGPRDDFSAYTTPFRSDTDFVGTDEFEYTVCDSKGNCDTATVTVDCGLPTVDVVDDYASTPKDTPVDIDILDNDSNIPWDGDLTVTQPDNGTVTVNDNGTPDDITDDTLTYTPDTDFVGTAEFDCTG